MPICALVLKDYESANELEGELLNASTPISRCQLVPPPLPEGESKVKGFQKDGSELSSRIKLMRFENVELLNPQFSRQKRQKLMALWLMPFGFIAGVTFAQMTGLETFSNIGLGTLGQPLLGGLLGMGSGLIGSYVATAGDNSGRNEDIGLLRKRHEESKWLLILETPVGVDLPWQTLQIASPIEIMRFNDL